MLALWSRELVLSSASAFNLYPATESGSAGRASQIVWPGAGPRKVHAPLCVAVPQPTTTPVGRELNIGVH